MTTNNQPTPQPQKTTFEKLVEKCGGLEKALKIYGGIFLLTLVFGIKQYCYGDSILQVWLCVIAFVISSIIIVPVMFKEKVKFNWTKVKKETFEYLFGFTPEQRHEWFFVVGIMLGLAGWQLIASGYMILSFICFAPGMYGAYLVISVHIADKKLQKDREEFQKEQEKQKQKEEKKQEAEKNRRKKYQDRNKQRNNSKEKKSDKKDSKKYSSKKDTAKKEEKKSDKKDSKE